MAQYDAVVVGSGPNGLAAAVALAQAGRSVLIAEAAQSAGGGARSAELTLPGFVHDACAAIHPLALASPFLRRLPLQDHGLEWIQPPAALAHPLEGGRALLVHRSVADTAAQFGADAHAYRALFEPLVRNWEALVDDLLAPLHLPRHPLLLARFGLQALRSATGLARRAFRGEWPRAMLAGMAGHSMLPLEQPGTAGFALMLPLLAHAVGWPLARGGSQRIADALVAYLQSLGGQVRTGWRIERLAELPPARACFLDVTPRQFLQLAGERLPLRYRRRLERFRYGPGVCKADYALDGPVPWLAPECSQSATVHVGGTLAEIAAAERAVWQGAHPERPFVLAAQQSLFDPERAPAGWHTFWAYCHVPHGSDVDMSPQIEAQVERFAPGFRDRIIGRHVRTAVAMERYNPNYIGGDINGGAQNLGQQFARPAGWLAPYATPLANVFLCSSSTPPGGGVHGMCGYHAVQAAFRTGL